MKKSRKYKTKGKLIEKSVTDYAPYRNLAKYTMILPDDNGADTSKS